LFDVSPDGRESGILAGDLEAKLLDPHEYRLIRRWGSRGAWLKKSSEWLTARGRPAAKVSGALGRMLAAVRRAIHQDLYATWWLFMLLAPWTFLFHGQLLRAVWSKSGATGTELFKSWLNEQLRVKLQLAQGERVRFEHLREIQLRVVAADLSKRSMSVFGGPTDQSMEIAEAVAASISYPFFFRPVHIGNSLFVDGGMVSNFPAWVLDELRAEQVEDLPTFGFRFVDLPEVKSEPWPGNARPLALELARRLVDTSIGSRVSLESRQITNYHPITLHTHVGTLDFHRLRSERAALVLQGEIGVKEYFERNLGPRDPQEMRAVLRRFAGLVQELTGCIGAVRAYLLQRTEPRFCRVVYSALLEGDADDALVIRWGTRSQAICLDRCEPILVRFSDVAREDRVMSVTKYLHATRPANVRHAYCVPLFSDPDAWSVANPQERPEPLAAICFDFDVIDENDLLLLDPKIEDWMTAIAQATGEYWLKDRILTALNEELLIEQRASSDWRMIAGAQGFYVSDRKTRRPLIGEDLERLEGAIRTLGSEAGSLAD
jgi:NTE family protein